MEDSQLEIVFELMGTKLGRTDFSGNRSAKCPLAPWTHPKGKDGNPSLTAKAGQPAVYRCWSCGNMGTVFQLVRKYSQLSGDVRPEQFVAGMDKGHMWGRKHAEYGEKWRRTGQRIQKQEQAVISEEKLKEFLVEVPQYAIERGMTHAEIEQWQIGYDSAQRRMIIPVRDYTGKLCGVSGRALMKDQRPKYKHYPGLKKEELFYGENLLDRSVGRVILVEGFFDVISLTRLGLKNVFATMGTSVSEAQTKKLKRWVREVVFIPDVDDDGAGLQFVQLFGQKLFFAGLNVGVAGVEWNKDFRLSNRPEKDWLAEHYMFVPNNVLKGKDPSDLSKEQLAEVMENMCWFQSFRWV